MKELYKALQEAYVQGYRKRAIMGGLKYDSISELSAKAEFKNWCTNFYGEDLEKIDINRLCSDCKEELASQYQKTWADVVSKLCDYEKVLAEVAELYREQILKELKLKT